MTGEREKEGRVKEEKGEGTKGIEERKGKKMRGIEEKEHKEIKKGSRKEEIRKRGLRK